MFRRQKESILGLLKERDALMDYGKKKYWLAYRDFLDTSDDFTDFAGENLEGKQGYLDLIEKLLGADENAKVFVEVYGFEWDGGVPFIYADTLIILSRLPLGRVERFFSESEDIFPSDIGEITDFSEQGYCVNDNGGVTYFPRQYFLIGDDGDLIPVENPCDSGYHMYYCWWD